ncbi:MAG TPA: hypothetical protein DCG57_13945, partial [Candidatus Riflebacteria bacterium]|nr:hypothetical protein [Candidatus Riflebacteria bacterium]
MLVGLPAVSPAQSGSYVETIYQAVDSAISQLEASGNESGMLPENAVAEDVGQIVDPDQLASGTAAVQQKIQSVIDSLVRILGAKMAGIPVNIKLLNCVKIIPPPDPGT